MSGSPQLTTRPTTIGPFRILEVLGQGGMGVVYKACDDRSGELAAVKTVRSASRQMLSGIRAEIGALRTIRHPGVVRVLSEGLADGVPWYAMELLTGETLEHRNRELWREIIVSRTTRMAASEHLDQELTASTLLVGGLAEQQVRPTPVAPTDRELRVAAAGFLTRVLLFYQRLCLPLAHIHEHGIIHRDIKPSNVFVRLDGLPVLMDFGLMSFASGTLGRETLTAGDLGLGTVGYIAPEQIEGRLLDARADLYSLGCMLYETLTGRLPFVGTREETLRAHQSEAPIPIGELVDGVPRDIEALTLALLAKRPQDRPGYAVDVAAAIDDALGESRLSPRTDGSGSHYLCRPHMTGRDQILAELFTRREQAEQGKGSVVLLAGESGIGKTFILEEFARRTKQRGIRVIAGECPPLSPDRASSASGEPLHAFRGVLQVVADLSMAGGPDTTERLLGNRLALLARYEQSVQSLLPEGTGEPAALPASAARERVLAAMRDTIGALLATGPCVVVLDDLQWADDLTLGLLAELCRGFVQANPLLVVGAYRVEEADEDLLRVTGLVENVPLTQLDRVSLNSMVADMLSASEPPERLVGFLASKSEGNPFFVAECLRLLVARGVLRRVQGHWQFASGTPLTGSELEGVPMPTSLGELLARRLDLLTPAARRVVQASAVLGREFDRNTLTRIADCSDSLIDDALTEARRRQVFERKEGNLYRFAHDSLRETAYATIPTEERIRLHVAALRTLEEQLPEVREPSALFPELAVHAQVAGKIEKSLEYLDKAGAAAVAKSATREALRFFKAAIDLREREGVKVDALTHARWCRQVGDALQSVGALAESAQYLRRAAALLEWPAPESNGKLVWTLFGKLAQQVRHRVRPRRWLESSLGRSEVLLEAARVHDRLQQVLYYRGDALPMLHACITTLNLAELAAVSPLLTTAYTNAHAVAGIIPVRKLAERYYRLACATNERAPSPEAESYLRLLSAVYRSGTAAWDESWRELERGFELVRSLQYPRRFEELSSIASITSFLQGRLDDALASARAICKSAARGDAQTLCWGLADVVQVLLVRERSAEALGEIKMAVPLLPDLGRSERIWVYALLALAALRCGDHAEAERAGDLALKEILAGPPTGFGAIDAYATTVQTFLGLWQATGTDASRAGFMKRARQACGALRPLGRIFPAAVPRHLLWRGCLGWLLGRRKGAVLDWRKSLAAARNLRMPYDEGLALVALAQGGFAGKDEESVSATGGLELLEKLGAAAPPLLLALSR